MKNNLIMKKLFIVLLALCGSMELMAQADPGIQNVLMSPSQLQIGQTGQLTTLVRNNGAVPITAGCVIVQVSVPTTICGATLTLNTGASDPMWTYFSGGSGQGFINIRNVNGALPNDFANHPIVLNVSADAAGGPLTIQATISYVNSGIQPGCAALGNSNLSNDNATTSLIVTGIYTWVGGLASGPATGNQWNRAANWSPAVIPTALDKAIIPNVAANAPPRRLPVLNADPTAIGDLQIDANATVDLNSKTFTINGAVTGTGTLKGTATSNLVITGNAGNIGFASGSATLLNLTLNSNAQASVITPLSIASFDNTNLVPGAITVASGAVLASNGNITLKSDANGTAMVASSAGNITGNVTVERYISNIGRKWRLLSGKSIGSTQTIRSAWQENGAAVNNLGTWVTKPGAGNGYDGSSNLPALLRYNAPTLAWNAVTATNSGSVTDEQGYMLFVRGDRNDQPSNASNSATVLRTTGTLNQHTQPAISIPLSEPGYTLVGNPFASSLDFENIYTTPNLQQDFYIWDAGLTGFYGVGGFRLVSRDNSGNYTVTPNDFISDETTMRYISSGQAFFVKATGGNLSLVLDESSKSDQVPEILPTTGGIPDQQILVNLQIVNSGGVVSAADGIRLRFDGSYSAGLSDDAEKISNFAENIASLRNNKQLVLERRPMIVKTDTIFLRLTNLGVKNYRLKIGTIHFVQTDATAYLEDTYLKTFSKLDLTGADNSADFSVTGDAASANSDRFRIVFARPPSTSITLKAAQQGKDVVVDWIAADQQNMKQYEVERSTDGTNFTKVETRAATGINGSTVSYSWIDLNAVTGDNYYRIRSTDLSAMQKYTDAVKVTLKGAEPSIAVYPNPVTDKMVRVKFTGMEQGVYRLSFISSEGRVMLTKNISHTGGNAMYMISARNMAAGNYHLEVISANNNKTTISVNVLN